MAWIESHQSLSRHRKTLAAVALLTIDRHKFLGHLHEFWWWGLDNADINGLIGHASPQVLAEAAGWPVKHADAFVAALVEAGFLNVTAEGVVIHDWYDFAGKWNERRAANKERMQEKRTNARAAHVQDTTVTRAGATVPNLTVPNHTDLTGDTPLSPPAGGKPARKSLSTDERAALIEKWTDQYGTEQRVEDEIDAALNHTSSLKCKSERLYVDRWLRRGIEEFKPKHATRNGHHDDGPFPDAECFCDDIRARISKYPKSPGVTYCEVHGDVRETA